MQDVPTSTWKLSLGSAKRTLFSALCAAGLLCPPLPANSGGSPGNTYRASVGLAAAEANGGSAFPAVSRDGRYVVFQSNADNLALFDTNGTWDIFRYDTTTGVTDLVTFAADGPSYQPDISADGRFVAYFSKATTLVTGDTNFVSDVFVKDMQTGVTLRASVHTSGVEGNGISFEPSISADGRYVAFQSYSGNLVTGDANARSDIFVHDTTTRETTLVSVRTNGVQANEHCESAAISGNGRFVAFHSEASNLVAGDNNGAGCFLCGTDVFVHDRLNGVTDRVSVGTGGIEGDSFSRLASVSFNGRYVAFQSNAQNLVPGDTGIPDIFVRDRQLRTTTRVSVDSSGAPANNLSGGGPIGWRGPEISAGGRFVVFHSLATNLASAADTNGTYDVFIHDQVTGKTEMASVGAGGVQGGGSSHNPAVAPTGDAVVFVSESSNLVAGDTNNRTDIFVRDLDPAHVESYCAAKLNSQGCLPTITTTGQPCASLPSGFTIAAGDVLNNKNGVLIYSVVGEASLPFLGGTLCLQPQIRRGGMAGSGGNAGAPDCSGVLSVDFNALIASGGSSLLTPGAMVWAQFLSRDPGLSVPDNVSLSDAVRFTILP